MKIHARALIFLLSAFLFLSCIGGRYISNEPRHIEIIRPRQPSNLHVWIDGDWMWHRDTRTYQNRIGRWVIPNRNQNYSPGYWEKGKKGKRWVTGKWRN